MNGYATCLRFSVSVLIYLPLSDINVYDRRFLPARGEPLLALRDHVNTHSTGLGFDIFDDKMLAAGGLTSFKVMTERD